MIVCKTAGEFQQIINKTRQNNETVGFVPTMGALHNGHLSLIEQSARENKITACSIFVNPIQFNNPEDLLKYPRTPEKDIALIEKSCQILFMPTVEEMYPTEATEKFSFGKLETVMEGAFREGHFNGVAIVVSRLFRLVNPDRAYFGEKDFQQLQIIKSMTQQLKMPIEVVGCPIVRESDGLAMSSRNARLSSSDRKLAPTIFQILTIAKSKISKYTPTELIDFTTTQFCHYPEFKVEYIEIAEESTLQKITHFAPHIKTRMFVAIWLGGIRLIDNIMLTQ